MFQGHVKRLDGSNSDYELHWQISPVIGDKKAFDVVETILFLDEIWCKEASTLYETVDIILEVKVKGEVTEELASTSIAVLTVTLNDIQFFIPPPQSL